MRALHEKLRRQNSILELRVDARTRELERAKLEILQRLAMAAEFRDDATGEHTQRVGRLCALMAEAMNLGAEKVRLMLDAAPLHDVGKIGVPDDILLKPGSLTPEEWAVMKRHTVTGARLLSHSVSPTLRLGERIALTHHEHWDGSGYRGLSGEDIPLSGRLVAVADAFDAMTRAALPRTGLGGRSRRTHGGRAGHASLPSSRRRVPRGPRVRRPYRRAAANHDLTPLRGGPARSIADGRRIGGGHGS
ncbi:MAG: HD-GYP domain-containing protein [Actinomycetota bacterium]